METVSLSSDDRDLIRSLIIADPALVLDDDQVMERLVGEKNGSRQVVDLRDRLVERLEQRLDKLMTQQRSIIAAAYENVAGTNQVHRAVLALLEPSELPAFLKRLTMDVPAMLGLEEARLCLEADVTETGPAEEFGDELHGRVMMMPEGMVDGYAALDGTQSGGVILRAAGAEAELIFGEANPVQSEALMLLDIAGAPSMLVFGSSDPKKFDPTHGTDLLTFLSGVIERLLTQRLADPEG
ncbi:MAG: DUF484 family protein [Pseudomonadota bacterium]